MSGGHRFLRPDRDAPILEDAATGDLLIPISSALEWLRETGYSGTEADLVREAEAEGARWRRVSAVNPDDPSESITLDFLHVPGELRGRA